MTRMGARSRFAALALALLLSACGTSDPDVVQGWVEADFIFVSPDEQGRVEDMNVREGSPVEKGMLLFTLDSELQAADLGVAQAANTNAKQNFQRAQDLLKSTAGTQKAYDDALAALRDTDAKLNAARTRLDRRKLFSPVAGTVHQIYFRPGETVSAGKPIIALLPPGNIKIRFFVAETLLPRLSIGDKVEVHCDGCDAPVQAAISFISRYAEFTPPVIYSREERNKLVYLIEARTPDVGPLRVGQPVDVRVFPHADKETGNKGTGRETSQ
jgi:HlyD family secretion protein